MRTKVCTATEYVGKEGTPLESFDLEVEADVTDSPEDVASKYLKLRRTLRNGIKETRGRPKGRRNKVKEVSQ